MQWTTVNTKEMLWKMGSKCKTNAINNGSKFKTNTKNNETKCYPLTHLGVLTADKLVMMYSWKKNMDKEIQIQAYLPVLMFHKLCCVYCY